MARIKFDRAQWPQTFRSESIENNTTTMKNVCKDLRLELGVAIVTEFCPGIRDKTHIVV